MRTRFLLTALLIAVPASLAAQAIDVTPFAGYRWGGTIDREPNLFDTDLEIVDSASYGLIVGFVVSPAVQVELSVHRQASELAADTGLFEPEVPVADVDLTWYQIGGTLEWGRDIRPFVQGSLGAATIDPDAAGATSETRFAGTFGAGVKLRVSDRIGFRLEGKGLWMALDDGDDDQICYDYCYSGSGIFQGEVLLGVIFMF